MGLALTYHVNLKLSTRQTAHALKEVHGIDISNPLIVLPVDMEVMKVLFIALLFVLLIIIF